MAGTCRAFDPQLVAAIVMKPLQDVNQQRIEQRIEAGASMPPFGMCAISERRAGARPSDRNGQSRWLLNSNSANGPCMSPAKAG